MVVGVASATLISLACAMTLSFVVEIGHVLIAAISPHKYNYVGLPIHVPM